MPGERRTGDKQRRRGGAARAVVLAAAGALLLRAPAAAGNLTDFARCLTRKGATLYGASWCPVCERQLEAFGRAAGYLDYIECSLEGTGFKAPECEDAGVGSFPTWEFRDGSRLKGFQSFTRLGQKTGCSLAEATPTPAPKTPAPESNASPQ